jgi:hypothetical protein
VISICHLQFIKESGTIVWKILVQAKGSLTFTNNEGFGFKVFGRGTEWETIIGGKTTTKATEETKIIEELLLQHATTMPEGLEQDLYAREIAKYFPNDPPDLNAPPVDSNALPTDALLAGATY